MTNQDPTTTIPGFEGHSPLPWFVSPKEQRAPSESDFLLHAAHGYVARMFCATAQVQGVSSLGPSLERAETNAALIVAAVNTLPLLDEMGKALEEQHKEWLLRSDSDVVHRGAMTDRRFADTPDCPSCTALFHYYELRGPE